MLSRSHQHFGRAVSRYADGELDAAAARALEADLLECETCRQELAAVVAIKASLRRLADVEPPTLAATRLRRCAENPRGLGGRPSSQPQDRVGSVARSGGYRQRLRVAALALALAVIAATGALLLHPQSPAGGGTVTALVELARVGPPVPPVATSGEEGAELTPARVVELGGRMVSLTRYRVDGREVLIAASDRGFAMPRDARPVSRERDAPWLAIRGDVNLACLSRPARATRRGRLDGG